MKTILFLLLSILSITAYTQEVDVVGKIVSSKKSILLSGQEQVFLHVKLNNLDTYIPLQSGANLKNRVGEIVRVKGRFKIVEEKIGERIQFTEKLKVNFIKKMELSDLRVTQVKAFDTYPNLNKGNKLADTASNLSMGDAAAEGILGGATLLLANSMGTPSTVEGKAQKSINVILLWTAIGVLFFEEAVDTFSFENASWDFKPYQNQANAYRP